MESGKTRETEKSQNKISENNNDIQNKFNIISKNLKPSIPLDEDKKP